MVLVLPVPWACVMEHRIEAAGYGGFLSWGGASAPLLRGFYWMANAYSGRRSRLCGHLQAGQRYVLNMFFIISYLIEVFAR